MIAGRSEAGVSRERYFRAYSAAPTPPVGERRCRPRSWASILATPSPSFSMGEFEGGEHRGYGVLALCRIPPDLMAKGPIQSGRRVRRGATFGTDSGVRNRALLAP